MKQEQTPAIIINQQLIFDSNYLWQPPPEIKWCLVTITGAGGGGAGGENALTGYSASRPALGGGSGADGTFCIFRFYPGLRMSAEPLALRAGLGGNGGKPGEFGGQGAQSRFDNLVLVEGGCGGTFSGASATGRILWKKSQVLEMISYGALSDVTNVGRISMFNRFSNDSGAMPMELDEPLQHMTEVVSGLLKKRGREEFEAQENAPEHAPPEKKARFEPPSAAEYHAGHSQTSDFIGNGLSAGGSGGCGANGQIIISWG
ncbi:glycine-rich domain-containing protein [Planctobacterium marinum]|uniref:glycine-rich domain-containing protein n=1 Tax=Planctobacterium marinum TaxID=1631968 RepID=UPI001E455DB1|nr:hypothetical protein [Planctobacterium marinum]MCC2605113.1 hypothetical protein [Planctobacterium marinum]